MILIISLLIYLKWYYLLYLPSTVNRNTLEDFGKDQCRMRKARICWKRIREPCQGNTIYEDNLPGWNIENRTNPTRSFVKSMDIRPAGQFSKLQVQTQTSDGPPKSVGGDYWRVFNSGPTWFAPTVLDLCSGLYEILSLVLAPVSTKMKQNILDHTSVFVLFSLAHSNWYSFVNACVFAHRLH